MTPILVEVVAPTLAGMGLGCFGCQVVLREVGFEKTYRDSCAQEYPPGWKEESMRLSEWIKEIKNLYKHRVSITVIDAQSPLGIWKQIRHRVRGLPAFIVDRRHALSGWGGTERLESLLDERIKEARVGIEAQVKEKADKRDKVRSDSPWRSV